MRPERRVLADLFFNFVNTWKPNFGKNKMNAEDFVKNFYEEKEQMMKDYFSDNPTFVGNKIKQFVHNQEQNKAMKELVSGLLTDTFYTILLGLDGCATIGGVQETFKIYDQKGNLISDCGEIEAFAYEYFHEKNN